jgi:predicted 3-demethylubiquinone-9 3-methyltransferase (glyoxalase superfamily)
MQKITPFLWFDDNAEEAVRFYTSIFENSKIGRVTHYDKASSAESGRPEGSVLTVDFTLNGQEFGALNGGPVFKFTPAISLFVYCSTNERVDELFAKLSAGGEVLMPLDKYPFSERYAFIKDKFGMAWQVMISPGKSHIVPSLLFVGESYGKAEEALKLYTSIFPNASVDHVNHYDDGAVMHSSFYLEGQEFMAMDGAGEHKFSFSEAVSLLVNCETQDEIDMYWERLTADGGQEVQCGWLKDKFGISWQIVPVQLATMLSDKDTAKAQRAMKAMLQMKKLDLPALQRAYDGS